MADKIDIPDSLKIALIAGDVIPFVGAGVSRAVEKKDKDAAKFFDSLFPSWSEFLESASEKLRGEGNAANADDIFYSLKFSKPKYLEAAQIAFDSLGVRLWNDLLTDTFDKDESEADEKTLELAQLVWRLGSNLVFTTNIDEVLEWRKVQDKKIDVLDTQKDEFAELLRTEITKPTLVYLHGRVKDKSNVVFTQNQYDEFYKNGKNTSKLETLKSFLARKTFLFIGFSLDDPYFVEQLQYVHRIYGGAASSFYVLLKNEELGKLKNLDFVKEIGYENFGEPLLKIVREMSGIAKKKTDDAKIITPKLAEIEKQDKNKPFFNVPYKSKAGEFVGRTGKKDEIWSLLTQDGNASINQASVRGFGGLGKTQLALEFAHTYKDKYKNGVFWLIADKSIDDQLLQIADKKGWTFKEDKTVNQIEVAKAKFLALSNCLIIFDNVEIYSDIQDYLPETDSKTHVLITSREKITEFEQINLDLLERDESRELLLKISKRKPSDETEKENLENILEELGDIPLAVELVGGYLGEYYAVSFSKYHQFLNEVSLTEIEEAFPDDISKHDKSIIRTLKISEKLIQQKPLMVEILNTLAWSASSSMGELLLQALVEPENELRFKTALGDALNLRVIKKDENSERYAIHRLLAKVIRHEYSLYKQTQWHLRKGEKLQEWFSKVNYDPMHYVDIELEIEHLREWRNHSVDLLPEQNIILSILESVSLQDRGNYQIALKLLQKSFLNYQDNNLENKKVLADIKDELGEVYGFLGNHTKELEYKLEALEIRRNLFGNEHSETANSLTSVGYAYIHLEKHDESLKYQLQALDINQRLFGEEHIRTVISLASVGRALNGLNRNIESLEYQFKALKIQRQSFGEIHPNTAATLNNIGTTYDDMGKPDEALQFKLQGIKIQRQLFGELHPNTATALSNIGRTYRLLGKYGEALKYGMLALKIRREILGERHPDTIYLVHNIVDTYKISGQSENAGRLAGEFLKYVPQNHHLRSFFERHGAFYYKALMKKKKRK